MKKVNLYFFRHGETDWNREKRFQGSNNIPLNQTGRDQAEELKNKIERLPLEVVISSDLIRAVETAAIAISNLSLPKYFFAELREANLGDMEGMFRKDFLEQFGNEMWQQWVSPKPEHLDFKFHGGETKRETRQRVIDCVEKFISTSQHNHVAVSTHGGVISRIVHFCENAPLEPVAIPNTCLYHIVWDHGRWVFVGEVC
ncbi:MAG: histidine phosphatase family protein [Bdellovibrionales bacterium]|nr:histidine phosphatase family protein [Bdellovibrionales bacterium]